MAPIPLGRNKWTEENLQSALAQVKNKNMSVNKASETFGIPRRTLRQYIQNNCDVKGKVGRKHVLNSEQENELCVRIKKLADIGYPITSESLRVNVYRFCKEHSIPNPFNATKGAAGKYWIKGFLARSNNISIRKCQSSNLAKVMKINRSIVNDHFASLRQLMVKYNFFNNPQNIYTMNDKECRLTLHRAVSEQTENITIISCTNAMGNTIPPMLLFKGQRFKNEWLMNTPSGTVGYMTPKGLMTINSFTKWLRHLAKFKSPGHVLLIFDGAVSVLDYSIVEEAERHQIVLYCLPSNTAHELQPLHKSVFRSFEHCLNTEVKHFWDANGKKSISKLVFGTIMTPCWVKAMSPSKVKSGFSATGIYPFNSNIIPDEAFAPSMVTERLDHPLTFFATTSNEEVVCVKNENFSRPANSSDQSVLNVLDPTGIYETPDNDPLELFNNSFLATPKPQKMENFRKRKAAINTSGSQETKDQASFETGFSCDEDELCARR